MINVGKLHRELVEAGIPIDGVSDMEPPRIDFRPEATAAQKKQAAAILKAHVPEDNQDRREQAYQAQGISAEAMIMALWEQVIEGNPKKAQTLQKMRLAIQDEFPPELGSA